jgi:uncharacterized protein (TIGR03067 family)
MPTDLEKLQGTWNVIELESDRQKMPHTTFSDAAIVVRNNAFKSTGMGAVYEGTLTLDPSQKPKAFDFLFTAGHAKGQINLGIYELDGDTWTICIATRGDKRPSEFGTKPNSGIVLETLKRAGVVRKPSKRKPKAATDLTTTGAVQQVVASLDSVTELEGEWAMTSAIFDGTLMDQNMVKWCKRLTRGNVTKVIVGPQVFLHARFTLDHSAQPTLIDYLNLEGVTKGKAQAGIYELNGDTLKICMAPPDQERPANFSSQPGDNRSYTTWIRVKK